MYNNSLIVTMASISLDLGCGQFPRNPFNCTEVVGIDIAQQNWTCQEKKFSLGGLTLIQHDIILHPLPFESGAIDFVTAYDFLEHVPRCIIKNEKIHNCFIQLMDEIFRVLKGGGLFHKTPCAPHKFSFVDPTHLNHVTEKTMYYFCGQFLDEARKSVNEVFEVSRSYGIKSEFVLIWSELSANHGHLMQHLRKPLVALK